MKILVCISQVPDTTTKIAFSDNNTVFNTQGVTFIINPYDVDGFANALTRAIDMDPEERRLRMRAMRRIVAGRNVFSWASDILEGLESLWTKPLQYAARAPEGAPV